MYGLAENIDLTFLLGRELIQVGIGRYQILLAFDEDDVSISVESAYEVVSEGQVWIWNQGSAQEILGTIKLFGNSITNFERSFDGSLKLTFSEGSKLFLRDPDKIYESYQIRGAGRVIVV